MYILNWLFLNVFFVEAFQQIKRQFFNKDTNEPAVGLMCSCDGSMEAVGHLFVASLVHDGPGPNFLSEWVYEYIAAGITAVKLPINIGNPLYESVRMYL